MPTPKNTIKGSMGTRNITANTGGPTEILPTPSSSYTSGDRVPQSTSPATLTRITLFTSRKNSRENSSNPPGTYSFGARHAYKVSEPPILNTRKARTETPRLRPLSNHYTNPTTPQPTT